MTEDVRNETDPGESTLPRERPQWVDSPLLASLPDAVLLVDAGGEVLAANERARDLFEDPVGADVANLIHPADREVVRTALEATTGGDGSAPQRVEHRLRRDDGTWVETSVGVAPDGDGAVVSSRDITARHNETAERESVLSRMTDGIYAVDSEWRFTYVNDGFCSLVDRRPAALVGSNVWEEFPEAVDTELHDALESAMQNQEVTTFTAYYDPFETWFEIRAYPGADGLSVYYRDVTEWMRTEHQLRAEKAVIESIFEASPVGIVVVDDDGNITRANARAEEILGLTRLEIESRTYDHPEWKTVDDEGRPLPQEELPLSQVFQSGEPVLNVEHGLSLPDGSERWLSVSAAPLDEAEGQGRAVATFDDITAEKRLRDDLRDGESALRRLTDETADTDLSPETKLERVLEIGCDRLDLPSGRFVRVDDAHEVVAEVGSDAEATVELLEAGVEATLDQDGVVGSDGVADAGSSGRYVGVRVVVDGERHGALCFAGETSADGPLRDTECAFVELLGQWVGHELERERARDHLERQNERLEEFASILTHDLRNPLAVARGRLDLALHEVESTHLDAVGRALERMEEIVDDVLEMAREGEYSVDRDAVALSAVATDAWGTVDTAGATLDVDESTSLSADPRLLKRLFENLFRNALEHGSTDSEAGATATTGAESATVRVTVGQLDDGAGFFVADDGPGIDPDDADAIFEAGYSTDGDGLGVGLSIVEDVVDAHGWSVSATTGAAGGARFEIRTEPPN